MPYLHDQIPKILKRQPHGIIGGIRDKPLQAPFPDEELLVRLSAAILTLVPDLPMSASDVQTAIRSRGLDGFLRAAGRHADGLTEIADLLHRLEKGGAGRGSEPSIHERLHEIGRAD